MKKILAIAPYPYLPFFSGGQKFIAQFLENMACETELTVISVETNDPQLISNYRLLPWLKKSFTRYLHPGLVGKISTEVKNGDYDAVIWEHPYYAWLAWLVRKKTGVPFVIHTHNIEYQRFRSMGKWWWPVLKRYERWAFRQADQLFFITPEDKSFAIKEWQVDEHKCIDLPFAVNINTPPADKAECRVAVAATHGIQPGEKIIFFNGLLSYQPNYEALLAILEKINPVLLEEKGFAYKLIVCGKGLPDQLNKLQAYAGRNILYAGFVDDIEIYFKAADLFLNPVQSGGGIKTKMVEAIAYGTTVIATETGATGINKEVCGNKLITVADNDWTGFAKAVIANRDNQSPTPPAYYDYYDWKKVARRIAAALC